MPPRDLQNLSASLFRVFGKTGCKQDMRRLMMPLWREAAGPVADQTAIDGLEDGVLRIVAEASFAGPIRESVPVLLQRLNGRLDPYHQLSDIVVEARPEPGKRGQMELPMLRGVPRVAKSQGRQGRKGGKASTSAPKAAKSAKASKASGAKASGGAAPSSSEGEDDR